MIFLTFNDDYDGKIHLKFVILYRWILVSKMIYDIIEDCSGKSTQVSFWWNWVIGSFEVTTGQKMFWLKFGWIDPFPVGVTCGLNRGHFFKCLKWPFMSIKLLVRWKWSQKYKVCYMSDLWLRKYKRKVTERSSGVKFSTMSDLQEKHVKLFILTCTLQKYILLYYFTLKFAIITCFWI